MPPGGSPGLWLPLTVTPAHGADSEAPSCRCAGVERIAHNDAVVDESIQPAEWGQPVNDDDFAAVESRLRTVIPTAWREYLQSEQWLREGWLESGDYVQLFDPVEALDRLDAWGEATSLHPGIFFLGGDGSRNLYCVDLRDHEPAVQLTDIASSGWHDMEPLLASVQEFVHAVRTGDFRVSPDD
jgi:hypothetical protein